MLKTNLFGNLSISKFGFGTMRLPLEHESSEPFASSVDKKESINMIRYAIDNGVNYVDTAYTYHGGESEKIVGEALKNGYRNKAILTTKLPTFLLKTREEMEKILDEQLNRLNTDYLDFYLLHTLTSALWDLCKKFDALDFLDRMIEKGKIKYAGFSFHDEYSLFEEIISSRKWDICQIQFNYLDTNYQAGSKGLSLANSKNIPVVIMEPLKGGQLAKRIPEVEEIFKREGMEYDPVKLSFRWIMAHNKIATILSGVHSMEQLKNNIDIFNDIDDSPLTKKEELLYGKIIKVLREKTKVGCTSCGYCMPCPQGVKIPDIFDKYNGAYIFNDMPTYRVMYGMMHINKNSDASKCIACKKCEKSCPQHIPIINTLKEAHKVLAKN